MYTALIHESNIACIKYLMSSVKLSGVSPALWERLSHLMNSFVLCNVSWATVWGFRETNARQHIASIYTYTQQQHVPGQHSYDYSVVSSLFHHFITVLQERGWGEDDTLVKVSISWRCDVVTVVTAAATAELLKTNWNSVKSLHQTQFESRTIQEKSQIKDSRTRTSLSWFSARAGWAFSLSWLFPSLIVRCIIPLGVSYIQVFSGVFPRPPDATGLWDDVCYIERFKLTRSVLHG